MNSMSGSRLAGFMIIGSLLLVPEAAMAQARCPEGKAFNGNCVNRGLATSMRQTSIVFAQPKISQTAFPVLPGLDLLYRYPHQLIPDPLKPAPAFAPSP
jgi:hypothetical protein